MCGREHSHIQYDGFGAADAFDLTFLEYSQECNLDLWRQIANFVQEDRSTISGFETPNTPLRGAGKRALFVSEEFRRNQRCRYCGAINRNKRPRGAARLPMQYPLDSLVALDSSRHWPPAGHAYDLRPEDKTTQKESRNDFG